MIPFCAGNFRPRIAILSAVKGHPLGEDPAGFVSPKTPTGVSSCSLQISISWLPWLPCTQFSDTPKYHVVGYISHCVVSHEFSWNIHVKQSAKPSLSHSQTSKFTHSGSSSTFFFCDRSARGKKRSAPAKAQGTTLWKMLHSYGKWPKSGDFP